MPAYYDSPVASFLTDDLDRIIGCLIFGESNEGFAQFHNRQIHAWDELIAILKNALEAITLRYPEAGRWHLLLEYPIPRRQKRIDAVLLAHEIIFVLEFKVGAEKYDQVARKQTEDYALDLSDFHLQSYNKTIIPILVATHAPKVTANNVKTGDVAIPINVTNAAGLSAALFSKYHELHHPDKEPIDPHAWNNSVFKPVPTIIEAAEALYAGQDVREICTSHSGRENLTVTSDRLIEAIRWAQQSQRKVICFVTGIPGSGKTLTGLNIVHNPEVRKDGRQAATFLSGNGPLVAVVREALAQNEKERTGITITHARHNASAFIYNVHTFINDAMQVPSEPTTEHVVIFDEAQRAWNAEQQLRKFERNASEPEMMLSIMDRHLDWAVIIALVGGGQEIHDGEAGLAEWGVALRDRFRHWQVFASPEVINGGIALAGHHLFEDGIPEDMGVQTDPALHLAVSIRSYKAEAVAHWVNAVLEGKSVEAAHIATDIEHFPMAITRSLECAKQWLNEHTRGLRRCGLVASSEAKRLRPYGIEVSSTFRRGISYEQWFLYPATDIRSSYQLEVAATEFDCQGLELDRVGICWDGDLAFEPGKEKWIARRLSGNEWRMVRNPIEQQYWLNKYRVLMTRAREGFVIWVPPGNSTDGTQSPEYLDATATYLQYCGLKEITDTGG
jgi:hypothetical protein